MSFEKKKTVNDKSSKNNSNQNIPYSSSLLNKKDHKTLRNSNSRKLLKQDSFKKKPVKVHFENFLNALEKHARNNSKESNPSFIENKGKSLVENEKKRVSFVEGSDGDYKRKTTSKDRTRRTPADSHSSVEILKKKLLYSNTLKLEKKSLSNQHHQQPRESSEKLSNSMSNVDQMLFTSTILSKNQNENEPKIEIYKTPKSSEVVESKPSLYSKKSVTNKNVTKHNFRVIKPSNEKAMKTALSTL